MIQIFLDLIIFNVLHNKFLVLRFIMLNFHNLKELIDILSNPYYVPHPAKVDLVELLEDVLELKDKKSPEEAITTLKDKIRNELKSEMSNELKQKINTQIQQLQQEKKILETKNEANKQLKEKATYIATASTGLAVGLVVYITLEHTNKLDMWLIVVIATVSAFLAGDLIMKPSSQVNGTQEPQGVANKNSV
ncbi:MULTISPECIES: hypothetical protein [unclassified Wolbachia]|nr:MULTISPECIES: hypothetical protein [unclassified Wolbachia]MBS9531053.1 hypothetical protein [Wolbachia endosymbiont of Rhagoletis cerasi]PBQ27654.1 hypothetical protein BTO27_03225 [Wolbachia pipientis wAus]CAQ54204.1 Hypothetical protein WP0096 [Wolbachia endosymbiont of Culex quinquefasciatus Pel]